MQRAFAAMIVLVIIVVVMATFVIMVGQETALAINTRVSIAALGAGIALLGQSLLRMAKKTVFGGWSVELSINGVIIESENEPLNAADGEKIIEYNWPWYIVLFEVFGFPFLRCDPVLRRDIAVERLLRDCCESHCRIRRGDPRKCATVSKERRVVTIYLRT